MGDGPPGFPQGFSCPAVLRVPLRVRRAFAYVAITLFGPSFQKGSASPRIGNSTYAALQPPALHAGHPTGPLHCCRGSDAPRAGLGLGCSDFARRYSRNRCCFLFLQVLRWFTSLGSLLSAYEFSGGFSGFTGKGFPIRKSPDHCLLAAPRGLSQLATSFIACLRQGIHRTPLVA